MKIFFYANTDIYDLSKGVSKKVINQIKALRGMGYEVFYSTYIENGIQILNNEDEVVWHRKYKINNKVFRYMRRDLLLNNVYKYLKKNQENFGICYLRFHYFDNKFKKVLKYMKQNSLVVVEAHGYPYRSWRNSIGSAFRNYAVVRDIIFEPFCRKYIDLVAAISNYNNIWGRKTVFIDNAVDVNTIKIHDRKPVINVINLISVAIEQSYHGYEKIIIGLDNYYKNGGTRNISIYMVGEYSNKTHLLVRELNMEKYVIFTGKLYGEQLEEIYDKADLAIGTFSKRANCEYGSSIKTKEFFAKGIPFINGWREYSFDDSCPFVKRFDLDTEYIDFNKVIEFYDSVIKIKMLKENMREFAKNNFTWEKQFKNVFDELDVIK